MKRIPSADRLHCTHSFTNFWGKMYFLVMFLLMYPTQFWLLATAEVPDDASSLLAVNSTTSSFTFSFRLNGWKPFTSTSILRESTSKRKTVVKRSSCLTEPMATLRLWPDCCHAPSSASSWSTFPWGCWSCRLVQCCIWLTRSSKVFLAASKYRSLKKLPLGVIAAWQGLHKLSVSMFCSIVCMCVNWTWDYPWRINCRV